LVCAPHGRDASLMVAILCRAGIQAEAFACLEEVCREIPAGAGALIITEEALSPSSMAVLESTLAGQEAWSDLPVIILTSAGQEGADRTWSTLRSLEPVANVSLLERPLRTMTLVSAVQVALRSRKRQYEVRSMNSELEKRVSERTSELQRLIREAEGFSYTISHDLRAPLRSIVSSSCILVEDYEAYLTEEAKKELHVQAKAARNMAQLIDDLLHLSRLSREQMNRTKLDLTSLVQAVVEQLENEDVLRHHRLSVQPEMFAYGDATLLKLLILNLLQNAGKFSSPGSEIRVGQAEDGSFFVADEGIGFEQRYAEKMFLPFERLVNDNIYPGTGIGLANVKRIIERHNGRVWATSPGLNQGATINFTLAQPASDSPLS
jgi:signal transduction histidine kinase